MPENISQAVPQTSFLLPQKVREMTAVKAMKSCVRSQARCVLFPVFSAPLLPPASKLDSEGRVQNTESDTESSKNSKKAKLNWDSFRTIPTVTASIWFSTYLVYLGVGQQAKIRNEKGERK